MRCSAHIFEKQSCTALVTPSRTFSSQGQRTINITHRSVALNLWQLAAFAFGFGESIVSFQTLANLVAALPQHHHFLSNPAIIKELSTSSSNTSLGLGSGSKFFLWARQHGSSLTHIHALVRKLRFIIVSKTLSFIRRRVDLGDYSPRPPTDPDVRN